MTHAAADRDCGALELSGLDAMNPLGFLAALGTLATAHAAGNSEARIRFHRRSTWIPVIEGASASAQGAFSQLIAKGLEGSIVPEDAERRRAEALRGFEAAKKACEDKKKEIKKRGLKGASRGEVLERELRPLDQAREQLRSEWLAALAHAVPRPELALGKRIDCTAEEFRGHTHALLEHAGHDARETLDLLAAFGSEGGVAEPTAPISSTPFCFITGSGHQYFLDTVRQLMDRITPERVGEALFSPWTYRDEGLSMRWDPIDDRRYALMDRDPTASDNKSRTVWMANLLAYRSLALFPCVPRAFRSATTCWSGSEQEPYFTWPIWDVALPPDTVRSVLQLEELTLDRTDRRSLRARGVVEVFRARRIKVGAGANYKLNFSPARCV